ncbi:hypothetical protein FD755_006981 [Muntiacus reevesi]|uniref:Fibrinogen C-terminal domain-containing protein n=2 Tax=Muntiacus TaxID=9885 RepID=A0A5J5MI30_MUNRE|nr:hypothetical protein FD754_003688 [Muntiacus muntjak]KAB0379197.1 hypothetical protein FD755_006981 [Muntiacus reevesi]
MRPLCVTCWWLGLLAALGAAASQKDGLEGTEEGSPGEFVYLNRYKRAGESPDKCTYTFIVPQQRVTGAICVNSKEPEVLLENRVHKQELELLNNELLKQKRQIETLQQLVEVDGGIVSEVKLLRKESRNMNSRVTQLYMQLLHEIIRKRDNALELSQLENRILNQTADMLQLASKYKDLEHKYQHLATLAHNQSEIIAQLEEHCQRVPAARPVPQPPPAAPPRVYQPPPYNRIINQISTNEIQSDQNLKVLPPPLPTMPTLTSLPSSTDKPSGFGNIDGEYWLGLENIYWLTNQGNYKLLVTMEDWSGRKVFAEYASFRLEPESEYYKLRLGRYHGNAGDSFTWHNGKQFTTLDRDHDVYTGNCAHYQKGGWWYNACAHSNLNGVWYRGGHYRSRYQDGVYWAEFRGGSYSLKKVVMMIRPNPNTFH